MKKIFLLIIILSLNSSSYALTNTQYELEKKFYSNYSFKQPLELQKEKDYYDTYIQSGYQSNIATMLNDQYSFEEKNDSRIVKYKDDFTLGYSIGPVLKKDFNIISYNCYNGLEFVRLEDRFFSFPVFNKEKTNIEKNKINFIPANSIFLDFQVVNPESNYQYFNYSDNILKPLQPFEAKGKEFQICIETIDDKYTNNSKETISIKADYKDEQAKNHLHNLIKRSIFGNGDRPSLSIDIENRRISDLKQENIAPKPKTNYFDFNFVFYILPLLLFLTLLSYIVLKYFVNRKASKEISNKDS
jgi:hypothetical protein